MSLGRFEGEDGSRRAVDTLVRSRLAGGDATLAEKMVKLGQLQAMGAGDKLIREGADDSDLYILLSGEVGIDVRGVRVQHRRAGDHVGEIAAADPSQCRSANVVVTQAGYVLKLDEPTLQRLAAEAPEIWRRMLVEANIRLVQRNALVRPANEKPDVFIISSLEALPAAQALQLALSHDEMRVAVWTNGVFRISDYPLDSLQRTVEAADFAIAVIHADDVVRTRKKRRFVPRDNVTFELGLFMGQLGRERTILVEPRDAHIKLASDLRGITTVTYRSGPEEELDVLLAPTATEIRKHINSVSVRR